MRQKTINEWKGLFDYAGFLSLPVGALIKATNVIFNKDGVIEPHRGYEAYTGSVNGTQKFAKFNLLQEDRDIMQVHDILSVASVYMEK